MTLWRLLSSSLKSLFGNGSARPTVFQAPCRRPGYVKHGVPFVQRNFRSIAGDQIEFKTYPAMFSQTNMSQIRFKKKKGRNVSNEVDEEKDDGDEEDEEDANENPLLMDDILEEKNDGSQQLIIDIGSLRLDSFAKVVFGMRRHKIEEHFYKGELYVNGERPSKKSYDLSIGDEIDLVKQINCENDKLLDIKRCQIIDLPDKTSDSGRMKVKIKRWQDLTIEPHESREN